MAKEASTTDTDTEPQDLAVFLTGLDKGRPLKELSAGMQEVVQAVTETGKNGKLQLTLTVSAKKAPDGAVFVAVDIRKTVPRSDPKNNLYFADDQGALSRDNPDQTAIF